MRGAFSMGQVGVREMAIGERPSPDPDPDEHPIALACGVLITVISIVVVWLIGGFNSLTNEREVVCTIISKNLPVRPPMRTSQFDVPDFEAETEPRNVTASECGTINVKQELFSHDLFDDLVVGRTYRLRVADRPATVSWALLCGSSPW